VLLDVLDGRVVRAEAVEIEREITLGRLTAAARIIVAAGPPDADEGSSEATAAFPAAVGSSHPGPTIASLDDRGDETTGGLVASQPWDRILLHGEAYFGELLERRIGRGVSTIK
jgi:hypothetical protein